MRAVSLASRLVICHYELLETFGMLVVARRCLPCIRMQKDFLDPTRQRLDTSIGRYRPVPRHVAVVDTAHLPHR